MIVFQSMNPSIGLPNCFVNRQTEVQSVHHRKMNTLGQRISSRRKELKMSQKTLAAKVGMSQGNLSELENDHYPSSSFVPRLAEVLKVSAIWLADGKKDIPAVTHIHPKHPDPDIAEVVRLMEATDAAGRAFVRGLVAGHLSSYKPAPRQKGAAK